MNKLKFNPDNAKYYSEDFIKGFECGVERQFNADMEEKTAKWIEDETTISPYYCFCSNCDKRIILGEYKNFCPNCGSRMKGENNV